MRTAVCCLKGSTFFEGYGHDGIGALGGCAAGDSALALVLRVSGR